MVGDMVSSCPLHISKVLCVVSHCPAISKNLKAFLYGWLPLSDASSICPCLCIPSVLLPLFTHGGALG